MDPMEGEPALWNGHQWVRREVAPATNSDTYFPALLPASPGNFTTGQLCGMGNVVLADPQGQTQLPVAGGLLNQAFNNALDTEAISQWPEHRTPVEVEGAVAQHPGLTTQEQARRAAVAGPGSQAPGVTISDVALHRPQLELPSDNQSATASGQSSEEVSTETSYQCDQCTESKGRPVVFTCNKDLQRHLRRTLIHNAPPVARCSCGKTVTRRDAMRSHRRFCQGTTVFLDEADAEGSGQGSMTQGMQQV